MSNPFFDPPILNSTYISPQRHWQLDDTSRAKIVITRKKPEALDG